MGSDYRRHLDPPSQEEEEDVVEQPLLLSNKLKIKLKVDPMALQMKTLNENHDGENSADRCSKNDNLICKLCNKEFSSGKALGGHMRVHVHRQSPAKENGAGKSSYVHDFMRDGKPTCSLCKKSFLSLKSLFGHMRCHPDRDWRGMKPPATSAAAADKIAEKTLDVALPDADHIGNNSAVNLLQSLPSWSKKAMRGRKSSTPMAESASYVHSYDEEDDSAVHGLMMLASSEKTRSESLDEGNFDYSDEYSVKKRRKTVKLKDLGSSNYVNDETPSSSPLLSAKCYECATCKRSFPSPQALGGHRSSAHNKNLVSKVRAEDDDDEEGSVQLVQHVCKICEKGFSSGQALGGHKRCHWQGHEADQAPPSSNSSSSPVAGKMKPMPAGCDEQSRPVLDFDLNEVPADEEEGINNGF